MRGTIIVETQEEFDRWLATQKPQYYAAFPDKDPSQQKKDTTAKPTSAMTGSINSVKTKQ
jgi:cytochrome c oxidase subunit 2